MSRIVCGLVLPSILLAAVAMAPPTRAQQEEAEFPSNHVGFFLGSTEAEEDEFGVKEDRRFTVGLNYERRLTRFFGVAVEFEIVSEGEREGVFLVPLEFHVKRAKFILAPGLQRTRVTRESQRVLRLGFEYEFEIGGDADIAPVIAYDFTEGERFLVLGVEFGWKF